jgi:hypothetical protein
VEKVSLFCNPASGTRSQALTIDNIQGRLKICTRKSKVVPASCGEARVRVGHGIPHSKYSLSFLMVQYSKDTCVKKKKMGFCYDNEFVKFVCTKKRTNKISLTRTQGNTVALKSDSIDSQVIPVLRHGSPYSCIHLAF